MNHRGLEKTKVAVGKLTNDVTMSCSRLPSLLGFNLKYSSPNQELQKSIDALAPGYIRPVISNDAIHFGNVTETVNLEYAARKLNLFDLSTGLTEPVKHKSLSLQGSLDGIANTKSQLIVSDKEKGIYCIGKDGKILDSMYIEGLGVLEAKLTGVYPSDKPDPARGPIQIQGLMMCTGYFWGAVSVLYQGTKHIVYVYESDSSIQSVIENEVKEFDNKLHVYQEEGTVDWYSVFSPNEGAVVYANSEKDLPSIPLDQDDEDMVEQLQTAKDAIAAATKLKNEATNKLMDKLAIHQVGEGKNYKITWGMTKGRKGYFVYDSPPARAKSIKVEEIL